MSYTMHWDPTCDTNGPWNQDEGFCDVCGLSVDDCICPVCPECGEQGNLNCYGQHGLMISEVQRESKERADREAREADECRCKWELEMEARVEQALKEADQDD